MGYSVPAQIGISAIPSAVKGINSLLNPSQPSGYEKKLAELADLFGAQANQPLTQTSVFQEGKAELNAFDKKNTEQTQNLVGAGNFTNEAKLATMQQSNQNFSLALSKLFGNASRFRQANQGKYLSVLGLQEQAKQMRLAQDQSNSASIVEPLSQATNSLLLSDLVGGKKKQG